MVDDFIVASRIQGTGVDVQISPVDVAGEAEAVAAQFRRYGAHITVTGEHPRALADRGRLRQVLVNLVSNAITHGGSTIRIELTSNERAVRCAVIDDGTGVAPKVEKKLFTRFVHDSNDALVQGSLGLGTWVARMLAEAMNGELVYRRDRDETVFELNLPLSPIVMADSDAQLARS
jgi:signal transduction histidine kinase